MKNSILCALLFGIIVLAGCVKEPEVPKGQIIGEGKAGLGHGYYQLNDSIYYIYWTPTKYGKEVVNRLEGVDIETIRELDDGYAYDKNNVYYNGRVLENADPETLEQLEGSYWRDKNFVFFYGEAIGGAHPRTFEYLGGRYTRDKNVAYYDRKIIFGADQKTFVLLPNEGGNSYYAYAYAKDKNNVYSFGKIIEGVDPKTFK